MASINNNIRGKKLFKEGTSGSFASKGSDGEITVSKEISDQLASLDDISSIFNDDALFQVNKFLVKQIEDLRSDVEELHGFIINAFGRDSSAAASQGARGATGSTGSTGAKGATGGAGVTGGQGIQGIRGATGAAGSDASVKGASTNFTIGKTTYTFNNGLLEAVR
tara:strand:+ start:391 stop:888 length:498 start_codon:yes stop_codon:yes gene_type:complete